MADTTLQIIVIDNDYCQHGSAVLYDKKGKVLQQIKFDNLEIITDSKTREKVNFREIEE